MATTTINTTAGEDTRLVTAFGALLRLGRNATQAEIKAWLVQQMTNVVIQQEQLAAVAALSPATPIAPS